MDSCDGIQLQLLAKRFDSDVEGFLRGFYGAYSFESLYCFLMVAVKEVVVYIRYPEYVQD